MIDKFNPKQPIRVNRVHQPKFHECEFNVRDSEENILTESPSVAEKVAAFLELAPQMFDALDSAAKSNMATMSGSARKKVIAARSAVLAITNR